VPFNSDLKKLKPWVAAFSKILSDKVDSVEPYSWSQLKLCLIRLCNEECDKKIREGKDDNLFADTKIVYDQWVKYWEEYESDIKKIIGQAHKIKSIDIILKKELFLHCLFDRLLSECISKSADSEQKLVHVHDKHRLRSNAYELIYYLINLKQRLKKEEGPLSHQPRLTHMLKVHSSKRDRPVRNVPFAKKTKFFLENLELSEFRETVWDELGNDEVVDWFVEVWSSFLDKIEITTIAQFQWKCFESFLKDALTKDGGSENQIQPAMITAGTGFGKTEAFIFPILFYALLNLLRGPVRQKPPVDAVLLYPRIDLCNDQLERCVWYTFCLRKAVDEKSERPSALETINESPFRITIAHSGVRRYEGENASNPFSIACPICKFEQVDSPGKIISIKDGQKTKFECKEHPEEHGIDSYITAFLEKSTKPFSIAITTVDTMHRRLMDVKGAESIWKNKEIRPRFFIFDEIHVYDGQVGAHVANLCRRLRQYLKYLPGDDRRFNPLPPFFIGVSATIGNPSKVCSEIFGINETHLKDRYFRPESEDTKSMGHEHIIMLKTPPHRQHTTREYDSENEDNGNKRRVVPEQSTLLQTIMVLWHGMIKKQDKYRMLTFVDSIDSVWRISKNLNDAEINKKLFAKRYPVGRPDQIEFEESRDNQFCPEINNNACHSPPHKFYKSCEVYNSGECWWTMRSSPDDIFIRPMNVLANASGKRTSPNGRLQDPAQWDCLVTTSTLEVGFDHPELIATVQYKAPPNPASFQQRKGRAGRGIWDTPITLVVLGNTPGDLFAFRHENRFFQPSDSHLSIPIDSKNPYVRNQHVLSSIYDYFSWCGMTKESDIYKKCDIRRVASELDKRGKKLEGWILDTYQCDGLNGDEAKKLYNRVADHIRKSIVTNLDPFIMDKRVYDSLDLFRGKEIRELWIDKMKEKVEDNPDDETAKNTYKLLSAADSLLKTRNPNFEPYLHPPDYFSYLPLDQDGNSISGQFKLPTSFIPEPIGGNVNVELGNNRPDERESLLQMLANFLPGGFKIRWNFKLWYGEWIPVPNKEGYADVTNICRNGNSLGTLKDNLGERPVPLTLEMVNQKSILIEPLKIPVSTGRKNFKLDSNRRRVILQEGDASNGPQLIKEPSSVVQFVDLPILEDGDGLIKLRVDENAFGVDKVLYSPSLTLLRLFHSNIVTAYPSSSGSDAIGITVRFWDPDRRERIIPTARLLSQGIRLEGRISKDNLINKIKQNLENSKMFEEHVWRNVYKNIWRVLLLGEGLDEWRLPNPFAALDLVRVLKFLDYREKITGELKIEDISQEDILEKLEKSRDLCEKIDLKIFEPWSEIEKLIECWDSFKEQILNKSRESMDEEIVESYSISLGRALTREIALETNTNLDMVEVSSAHQKKGEDFELLISVYDQIQGGSGTVLSFIETKDRSIDIDKIIETNSTCQTFELEQKILRILQDKKHNADTLFSKLDEMKLESEMKIKIKRLLVSEEVTAFYIGVAENYKELNEKLKRVPTSVELAISLHERPISDIRGRNLVMKFSDKQGGIAALIPRVEEIIPICIGSCPDCLGDSRFSYHQGDLPIPDRFTLDANENL